MKKIKSFSAFESLETSMKYLRGYKYFRDYRPLKEEFISKFIRTISGKNTERINQIRLYLEQISEIYSQTVTVDFGGVSKEFKEKTFDEIWSLSNEAGDLRALDEGGKNLIKNMISILKVGDNDSLSTGGSKINTELEFIKSLDEDEYLNFKAQIEKVVREFNKIKYKIIEGAWIKNLEKITEQKSKALAEAKRILSIIKSKEIFYYYSGMRQSDKSSFSGKNPFESEMIYKEFYKNPLSSLVKSMVLKLSKNKKGEDSKVCEFDLSVYKYPEAYYEEYGIDYISKYIGEDILNKKIGDLENFKKLIREVEEIKPILEEFYKKLDTLSTSLENLRKGQFTPGFSNRDKWGGYDMSEGLGKYLDSYYLRRSLTEGKQKKLSELLRDLKTTLGSDYKNSEGDSSHEGNLPPIFRASFEISYHSLTLDVNTNPDYTGIFARYGVDNEMKLEPLQLIESINKFKVNHESKTVKEILKACGDEFPEKDLLTVVESDKDSRSFMNKTCGNVLYHGSIHYRLDKPGEIEKLIYKRSPYVERYAGLGVYCTTYMSAACQYQYLRGTTGGMHSRLPESIRNAFSTANSDYFPCIYKFTLKPGSKFEFLSDTNMDRNQFDKLKKIGLQGIHSGPQRVSGGETQETCIVDPECIIKIEKLNPSEILALDDNLWRSGVDDFTKEEFMTWYKNMIQKRKDN